MPNQNYFEATEELKMAQCDLALSYPTCKTDERLCKFAYASWCPTCDKDSPRRRSKSETNEPCRKKGRDMKGISKKYDWNLECENMELEYESKDLCCHDTYRIRSNLCELPTTYITNNCQHMKLSNCSSEFVDSSEKVLKYYDNNIKLNDQLQNFGNMVEKHDRISKFFPKIEESARNINGIVNKINPVLQNLKPHYHVNSSNATGYLERSSKTTKANLKIPDDRKAKMTKGCELSHNSQFSSPITNESYNLEFRTEFTPFTHHRLSQGDCKLNKRYLKSPSQESYAKSPQSNKCHPNSFSYIDGNELYAPHYDTCTFFDKQVDIPNLKERYSIEVELLKEKLKSLKHNSFGVQSKPMSAPIVRSPFLKYTEGKESKELKSEKQNQIQCNGAIPKIVAPPKEVELLATVHNKKEKFKSGSKVSLKTKAKSSTAKLRKQRTKASTDITNAETCNSDYSGSEDSDKESDHVDEPESSDDVSSSSTADSAIAWTEKYVFGSGDSANWPVRASLFSHIPPYLCFVLHDAKKEQKLPYGTRLLKWKLSTITPVLVRKTLTNSGFRLVRKSNEWMGTWGKHMKSPMFKTLKDTQKLNHFPGTFQIGRKDRLWRNLQRLIVRFGHKEFGFTPQTYVLPQDLKLLKHRWQNKTGSGNEKYIIKPPASARGTGIKVINRWSQLPKRMSLVVQEYISNPYLINGSKFDLRLYVLVTSFDPLRIYLYPDGLARFASVPYSDDVKDLKDRYMHLTNYSINKMSTLYTANEDANSCKGHKWTISKLLEYMSKRGVNTKLLWKDLQQLVIKTLISGESTIVPLCRENMNSRYNCYELFGVDVLLDENLKSWLLEVNISPSLHSQSPLDEYVKGPLVKSLFELAQFHLPPKLGKFENKGSPSCFDNRIYTTTLTKIEQNKHNYFCQAESREEYLEEILNNLTGDDVRHLTRAEDELVVIGQFEKIFPTAHTYHYLEFLDVRYYNRLFDAWECRYEKNRQPGIKTLQSLCNQKVHLKVAPPPLFDKSLLITIPGDQNLQASKDGQTHQETIPQLPSPLLNFIPSLDTNEQRNISTNIVRQYLHEALNPQSKTRRISSTNCSTHV